MYLQTTVQEESKNLKEDLKSILESVVREEVQSIKREFKAITQVCGRMVELLHQTILCQP